MMESFAEARQCNLVWEFESTDAITATWQVVKKETKRDAIWDQMAAPQPRVLSHRQRVRSAGQHPSQLLRVRTMQVPVETCRFRALELGIATAEREAILNEVSGSHHAEAILERLSVCVLDRAMHVLSSHAHLLSIVRI